MNNKIQCPHCKKAHHIPYEQGIWFNAGYEKAIQELGIHLENMVIANKSEVNE